MPTTVDSLGDRVWVGRHTTSGETLVFDGSWQPQMPDKARLYCLERQAWVVFKADIVRSHLYRVRDAAIIRSAVDAYANFERVERAREAETGAARSAARAHARTESEAWLADAELRHRERTLALHHAHLARFGITEREYEERPQNASPRVTHCWACKEPLDSRQDIEHIACGWLVCSCGACGCGRNTP